MSTYSEAEHPRSATGRFEAKPADPESGVILAPEEGPDPTGKWSRLDSEEYRAAENELSAKIDAALAVVRQVEDEYSALQVSRAGLAARTAYPDAYGVRVQRAKPGEESDHLRPIDLVDAEHRSVVDDSDFDDVSDYMDLSGVRSHHSLGHLSDGDEGDSEVLSFDRAEAYLLLYNRARNGYVA